MRNKEQVKELRDKMVKEIVEQIKTLYKSMFDETPIDEVYEMDYSDISTRETSIVIEDDYRQFNRITIDKFVITNEDIYIIGVDKYEECTGEIYFDRINTDDLAFIADIIDVAICHLR